MACEFFGPYDPENDPKDTVEKWMKSCPSAGGEYPKACLLGRGIYLLYCCTEAGDNPCTKGEGGVVISLPGEAVAELEKKGKITLFGGKAELSFLAKRHHG
jgi:hypothetical protein